GKSSYAQTLRDDLRKKFGATVTYTNVALATTKVVSLAAQVDALPKTLAGPVVVTITDGENDMRAAWDAVVKGTDAAARSAMTTDLTSALDKLLAPGRFGTGVEVHVYTANLLDPSDGMGD